MLDNPQSGSGLDEGRLRDALSGRTVLLTGHTGFKGGWLALWLHRLGARVVGAALPPPTAPSLFRLADVEPLLDHRIADLRQPAAFAERIADVDADLVIHMAAQPLVRLSYEIPLETYLVNVVGTAAVLDAARAMPSLKGVVVVTSDKCYENNEWIWGYRENDPMGGADPYSSSKGCAELVVRAYARSFFSDPDGPALASVRAGNVFGGGDWAADRLVADLARAAGGGAVRLRRPDAVRPWQHVLEPLAGYLQVAARLLEPGPAGRHAAAGGWNFGPDPDGVASVADIASLFAEAWGTGAPLHEADPVPGGPHEARILRLDSTKARVDLGWRPRLGLREGLRLTADWYKDALAGEDMRALSLAQIEAYAAGAAPATPAVADKVFI